MHVVPINEMYCIYLYIYIYIVSPDRRDIQKWQSSETDQCVWFHVSGRVE